MNTKDIYVGASPEGVAALITNQIVSLARSSKHPLSVALSGGSTPDTLFDYWLKRPKGELENLGIRFWWVDERLVPVESPDSNYGNAYRRFFSPSGYPSELLFPIEYSPEATPEQNAQAYDELLKTEMQKEARDVPFDLVILGVGDDGHTSSLFPRQDLFDRAENYIPSINPYNGIERVALSYNGILRSKQVLFHVLGEKKREILKKAIDMSETSNPTLPSAYIMANAKGVSLFTDQEL